MGHFSLIPLQGDSIGLKLEFEKVAPFFPCVGGGGGGVPTMQSLI